MFSVQCQKPCQQVGNSEQWLTVFKARKTVSEQFSPSRPRKTSGKRCAWDEEEEILGGEMEERSGDHTPMSRWHQRLTSSAAVFSRAHLPADCCPYDDIGWHQCVPTCLMHTRREVQGRCYEDGTVALLAVRPADPKRTQ